MNPVAISKCAGSVGRNLSNTGNSCSCITKSLPATRERSICTVLGGVDAAVAAAAAGLGSVGVLLRDASEVTGKNSSGAADDAGTAGDKKRGKGGSSGDTADGADDTTSVSAEAAEATEAVGGLCRFGAGGDDGDDLLFVFIFWNYA